MCFNSSMKINPDAKGLLRNLRFLARQMLLSSESFLLRSDLSNNRIQSSSLSSYIARNCADLQKQNFQKKFSLLSIDGMELGIVSKSI